MDTTPDIRAHIDADTRLQSEINDALLAVAESLQPLAARLKQKKELARLHAVAEFESVLTFLLYLSLHSSTPPRRDRQHRRSL